MSPCINALLDKNSKISGYKEPDRASNIEEMKIESNYSHIDPLYTGMSTLAVDDPSAPPASCCALYISSEATFHASLIFSNAGSIKSASFAS